MRNPLTKRIPREIKNDLGKYIALFLFLILSIGFISGFLVAGDSMKSAFDNSFEKYNVEDGHFCLATEIDDKTKENVENLGVKLYKNFYVNKDLDNGNTFRLFKNRTDFNEIAVFEGNLPENNGEIAIDRLYAENNEIKVGDKIKVADKDMTVSATVAFSDYTSLFKNNTDMMFDAKKFSVAVVTDADFDEIADDSYTYCYSWIDNDKNLSDSRKNDLGDDVKEELAKTGMLTDFVKRADNQAIMFSGDDIGSDKAMMLTLLYVLIIVFGFIFAITSRDTVEQEASVIGTLRASGYTRGELTRHYLVVPTLVTFTAAVIGNILGYTAMKNVVMNMYYHSYSLPPYQTLWNGDSVYHNYTYQSVCNCKGIEIASAPVPQTRLPYEEKEKGGKASEFQISYPFPSENYSPEHSVIHNYGVRNYVCRSAVILWTCTQSVACKLQNRGCKQYDLRLSVCYESSC